MNKGSEITKTKVRQKSLLEILDEIEVATSDLEKVALVKALRLALAQLESMKTYGFPAEYENQAVTGTLSAIARLLREPAD